MSMGKNSKKKIHHKGSKTQRKNILDLLWENSWFIRLGVISVLVVNSIFLASKK
jgi:hypothetical protein